MVALRCSRSLGLAGSIGVLNALNILSSSLGESEVDVEFFVEVHPHFLMACRRRYREAQHFNDSDGLFIAAIAQAFDDSDFSDEARVVYGEAQLYGAFDACFPGLVGIAQLLFDEGAQGTPSARVEGFF